MCGVTIYYRNFTTCFKMTNILLKLETATFDGPSFSLGYLDPLVFCTFSTEG